MLLCWLFSGGTFLGSPYQYTRASKAVLVATTDNDIYVACAGPCNNVKVSNSNEGGMMMASIYKGGVAKFSAAGEPQWISELPTYPQGMAAMTDSAVYVSFYESTPVLYGVDNFTNWEGEDTKDQFIIKFHPEDGRGEWVMQQGGTGKEYVRRMAMDKHGDIYTTGKSGSNPGYFDTIQLTTHNNSNSNDMFLAKMVTSSEDWPSCKTPTNHVKPGYCFFQNTCFENAALMPPGDVVCVGANATKDNTLSSSASSSFMGSLSTVVLSIMITLCVIGNIF